MLQIMAVIDPTFHSNRIMYEALNFIEYLKTCKAGQAVQLDEGNIFLFSRQAMSASNVNIVKLFTMVRQKRQLI